MNTVYCMFHNVMRARGHLDDDQPSTELYIYQGLRQRCILSPLSLNIFSVALIDVIIQWFTTDSATVLDLVHLEDVPKSHDRDPLESYRWRRCGARVGNAIGGRFWHGVKVPRQVCLNYCRGSGGLSGVRTNGIEE